MGDSNQFGVTSIKVTYQILSGKIYEIRMYEVNMKYGHY